MYWDKWASRSALLGFGLVLFSGAASALKFDLGPVYGSMSNNVTLGAAVRMSKRDPRLVAKSNLQPGLCTRTNRTSNPGATGPISYPGAQPGDIGETCNDTTDPFFNQAYVDAPGSFNINGDNGNLNFDQGDVVSAAIKMSSKIRLNWDDFTLYARTLWFYDDIYASFDEQHPDTTFQRAETPQNPETRELFGMDFDVTDLYLQTFFDFAGTSSTVTVGRHRLNWGESTALPLNSINTTNPPDLRRTRVPGSDLDELFIPVGMVSLQTQLSLNLSSELFYQYEWRGATIDAPGTFYSTSDILGGDPYGGQYAMLSFGKAPEDPQGLYASQDNSEDPFALGSAGSRTIYREADRKPRDGGQFGLALRYFAENFNNGTEFAFYFANYHSRLPSVSLTAADETCAVDAVTVLGLVTGCGALLGDKGTLRLSDEPLPIDTASLFAEYPEDIQMYGVSFNTTVGDWAWSGEYSFRPNVPVQIHTIDLIFAALQPAFPRNNVNLGQYSELPLVGIELPQLPIVPGTVFPSRRVAVPDYVQTLYRGGEVEAGQYIRGYERLQLGQLTTTLLRILGSNNLIGASQVTMVGEFGITHVVDFPSLNEIQFQGAMTDTHASPGADGTTNGLTDSATLESNGDGDPRCRRQTFDSIGGAEAEPCRQNPTAQNPDNFGDAVSYGVRLLTVSRYNNLFWGANFELLAGLFYDIDGIAPGVGQNFQEGNTTGLLGLRLDYQNTWFGELRYTEHAGKYNVRRDRDTLSFTLRYEF